MKIGKTVAMLPLAVALALPAGVLRADAGATHTDFAGTFFLVSPCTGEFTAATGPVKIAYNESRGSSHFAIHLTFKSTGIGDQGNAYLVPYEANGQFDEPSGGGPGFTYFDLAGHGEAVTEGSAPNFGLELGIRVFVVAGTPAGAQFIAPFSFECHG
jgi:hypothetical protein